MVFEFLGSNLPEGSGGELCEAAMDLMDLPFRSGEALPGAELDEELLRLCTAEERSLYRALLAVMPMVGSGVVERQVLLRDLVGATVPAEMEEVRVDLVLEMSRLRWVVEIGGQADVSGRETEAVRDRLLGESGWEVRRVSAAEVRDDVAGVVAGLLGDCSDGELRSLGAVAEYGSVEGAMAASVVHKAAWHSLVVPLAVQRMARGFLWMYRYGALDPYRRQRLLVIEEDAAVVVEALRQVLELWRQVLALLPDTAVAPAPEVEVDVLDGGGASAPGLTVRAVRAPEGEYDAVVSASVLMKGNRVGFRTGELCRGFGYRLLMLRGAVGMREERRLCWSPGFVYGLDSADGEVGGALRWFLRECFRKSDFLDGQLRAVLRLLAGESSIVLLPTGGGKSLIYQFVGMLLPGMVVVVDPIVSLIDDQVWNLRRMGIDRADGVSGQVRAGERVLILARMAAGELGYVFIAPERLQSAEFREQLQQVRGVVPVSLAVVDEAHCLSEWGHDFRPSYLHLPGNLQRYCTDVGPGVDPVLVALTGTASYAVLEDIQAELGITEEDAVIMPASFDRRELEFAVRVVSRRNRVAELNRVREAMPGRWGIVPEEFFAGGRGDGTDCGLVFCPHVNGAMGVVEVASALGHSNYYSGSRPKEFQGQWEDYRRSVQRRFTESEVQELVTTKSFGMGIDKPNVRYTIHFGMAASVEAFYQEAGRAGRNGREGYGLCSVLYCDDSWDRAVVILDEPDHVKAFALMNGVRYMDRGDVLMQLWFILNSYRGREGEKAGTVQVWRDLVAAAGGEEGVVVRLGFDGDSGARGDREKYVYRLAMLGLVDDYTVDWRGRCFNVGMGLKGLDGVEERLRLYLGRYRFPDSVERMLGLVERGDDVVEWGVGVLVDFIYDEVVSKRKQALRTVGELCRNFRDGEEFRGQLLAYLQDSEFTDELSEWRGEAFDGVGLARVRGMFAGLETPDTVRRLVGSVRRMLDADPDNVAFRYLSVGARALSDWEPDGSVVGEVRRLFRGSFLGVGDPDGLRLALLADMVKWRAGLTGGVASAVMEGEGGRRFARRVLLGDGFGSEVRGEAVKAVVASVAGELATISGFYEGVVSGGSDE